MNEEAKNSNDREAFIEDLLANNFTTYFVATHPKYAKGKEAFRFTSVPVSPAVPHLWKYSEVKKKLFELGNYLTTEEAERRNINFVNPGLKDFMPGATLPTLRGGMQLLLPGEHAYTHRHSANAFRVVMEAPPEGDFTSVEGTKVPMHPGDLILTPNWTWHDHHNEGDSHAIWYDGLDALMAFWIGGGFFQLYEEISSEAYYPVERTADTLMSSYGPGMVNRESLLPEHIPASDNTLLYYPYSRARQLLQELASAGVYNQYDGVLLEYVNPLNGEPSFPSMNTSIRLVKGNTSLEAMHRTENIIFITMEGSVTFNFPDNRKLKTEPFDVVAIPSWVPYSMTNSEKEPAILFSQSDRPLFQKLEFYREEPA